MAGQPGEPRASGDHSQGPSEHRAGVSLNGLLALVCGLGLLLSRYGLIAAAGPGAEQSVEILIWVAVVVLLLVGLRATLGTRIRRGRSGRQGRRVRRAPREGLYYLAVMTVLLIGSFLGGENMLMLVVALLIGPWLLNAWASGTLLHKTTVRRIAPPRAMAGDVVSVELVVENRKRWLPAWLVLASDQVENEAETLEAQVLFANVPGGEARSGYYRLRPGRRGRYQLGPIELSTRFPLGLVERGLVFHRPEEIRVYPRLGRVAPWWYRERMAVVHATTRQAIRRGVADDEFQRLREFRGGDNPRSIHWRTSARRGELMVREFDQQREEHLEIVLDLWQPRGADEADRDRVELAVSLAATLAATHLRQARETRVEVVISGRGVTRLAASAGHAGLHAVLDLLATVQPGPSVSIEELLVDPVPTGTCGLVITTRPVEERGPLAQGGSPRQVIGAEWDEVQDWFGFEER